MRLYLANVEDEIVELGAATTFARLFALRNGVLLDFVENGRDADQLVIELVVVGHADEDLVAAADEDVDDDERRLDQICAFEKQSGKSKLQTEFGLGRTRRTTARNSGLKSSIVPKQIFLSKMRKRQQMRFRVQMKAAAPRSLRTKGKSGLTPVSQATHFAAKLSPSRDPAPKFGTSEEEARLKTRRSLLSDSRKRA